MDRATFLQLLPTLRPALHRYCARMTGSVIDGEDLVQSALARALESFESAPSLESPEGWVFRIAHNATLDLLRRRAREQDLLAREEAPEMSNDGPSVEARVALAASLRTFLRLPVSQRSSVLLMDVLGHSLEEIAEITGSSVPAIKSALHRGRIRLRELSEEPEETRAPVLTAAERAAVQAYVDRFNAHDFDAVRDMLAEEVRLDLVAKTKMKGKKEVATYFHNYSGKADWLLTAGLVEGRPAALVLDPAHQDNPPLYFVLLEWSGGQLATLRDFRYARYATDGAELVRLRR
jgi:RNA polymerase sigma-70 factor (ECF subfamily)